MKSSQQTTKMPNVENAYRHSKCPCPANQGYSRKSDRTPLGAIQDLANKNQYLTVDFNQKEKSSIRSKSVSLSRDISSFKPSSGQRGITAESTRIAPTPPIKQTLKALPATITIRQLRKLSLQRDPVPTGSSSCRCSGVRDTVTSSSRSSNVKFYKDNNTDLCDDSDDVFLPPTAAKPSAQPKTSQILSSNPPKTVLSPYLQLEVPQNKQHDYVRDRDSHRQSLKSTSSNQSLKTTPQTQKTHLKTTSSAQSFKTDSISHSLKSTSSNHSLKTTPQTRKKHLQITSSTQKLKTASSTRNFKTDSISQSLKTTPSRLSVPSARPQSSSISTDKQISQNSEDFVPWLTPTLFAPKPRCSSALPKPSSTLSSALESFQSTAALKESKDCCRASSTCSTSTDQSADKNTTLPTQNFVTLSQESLEPTVAPDDTSESNTLASIPLSKVKIVRDSSIFSEEERSFVDGQAFFQDLEQGKRVSFKTMPVCSPLNINVPIRRSNSISEGERSKRVKTTLRRSSSIKKPIAFPLMYSPEYLEDIISHSYKHRLNLLLKPDWIDRYMDKRYRTMTVNWLHQITVMTFPHLNLIYSGVRIFDYAVVKLGLRKNSYQLAAIVALWLSLKYLDNTVQLKVSKIFALMSGQYSKAEILSMETAILKTIRFSLNISDPLDFLYYYLKSSNLENNELLIYGSKFVLECATLFETYPIVQPPFIAASALYLAYKVLSNTKEVNIDFFWYDQEKIQKYAETVLANNVKYVIMNKHEPLSKYLTPEKLKVAMKFFRFTY